MRIRSTSKVDAPSWSRLRCALWPGDEAEHALNVRRFLDGKLEEPTAVWVAEEAGDLIGFIELSIRAYAEGCNSDHVGYVEGWYVSPAARGRGVGRALIVAAEDWARSEGCGFQETGQIRCYRKAL